MNQKNTCKVNFKAREKYMLNKVSWEIIKTLTSFNYSYVNLKLFA